MSLSRLFQLIQDRPISRWAKAGETKKKKKHLTHPQAELGLSHMWREQDLNPHQTQW